MQRHTIAARPDWQARVEALGFVWHSADDQPYWSEGTYYTLTEVETDRIAAASEELHKMFIAAGDRVIERNLFSRFGIPEWCVPLIRDAWDNEPPALNYGRFDLGLDRDGMPRLFEYNCDTPTSLVEASLVQWYWKQDVLPKSDQYNSIHEALVARWQAIAPDLPDPPVHFAHAADSAGEDMLSTAYMMDIAREAGLDVARLTMREIGWASGADGGFFDGDARPISALFKLYPWEWLTAEAFGRNIGTDPRGTLWIEPIWKMLWSNKAILAVLWELYPDHPNLLSASFHPPPPGLDHVIKPMLGREGGNVKVVKGGHVIAESEGGYTGPVIYQELCDWQDFEGRYPVIGSWMVDGTCCGVGIREGGPITTNRDRFVPHVIDG
jgi:glutathionylspermidine synthase